VHEFGWRDCCEDIYRNCVAIILLEVFKRENDIPRDGVQRDRFFLHLVRNEHRGGSATDLDEVKYTNRKWALYSWTQGFDKIDDDGCVIWSVNAC
jgi:hypothetical protein